MAITKKIGVSLGKGVKVFAKMLVALRLNQGYHKPLARAQLSGPLVARRVGVCKRVNDQDRVCSRYHMLC